jgi:hypothetical protein
MGATAAIAYASNHFLGNPNPVIGLRNQNVRATRELKNELADLSAPIAVPPPPSTAAANDAAGIAAASAGAIARRRAMNAGGFASTVLTSPQGAPPVATIRKTLLGQ